MQVDGRSSPLAAATIDSSSSASSDSSTTTTQSAPTISKLLGEILSTWSRSRVEFSKPASSSSVSAWIGQRPLPFGKLSQLSFQRYIDHTVFPPLSILSQVRAQLPPFLCFGIGSISPRLTHPNPRSQLVRSMGLGWLLHFDTITNGQSKSLERELGGYVEDRSSRFNKWWRS